MKERPLYEIKFGIVFADKAAELGLAIEGQFKVVPYATMTEGDLKSAIDDNILAEFDIPYHPPVEVDERIYALNFHVAGVPNDEIVLHYMMIVQPFVHSIFQNSKQYAKPFGPYGDEE
jgi:hypothetical protein